MTAQIVQRALYAIKAVESDTSVTPEETLSRLDEIRDELEAMIEALKAEEGLD